MSLNRNTIEEGNRLIAKFKGWFEEEGGLEGTWYEIQGCGKYVAFSTYKEPYRDLPFHRSWNYLMPVIEQIGKLIIDRFPINVNVHTSGIYIAFNPSNMSAEHKEGNLEIVNTLNINYFNLDENNQTDMITSCWLGVVEFIEWYNKQNKS